MTGMKLMLCGSSGCRATMQAAVVLVALCGCLVGTTVGQEIVAHRGASHDAPENTLAAFRLAWEQGADAIEGDFHLTADGHIVAMHDRTTKRTAGVELEIASSTLEQLRALDVGAWKGEAFVGERIPTLDEVLQTVPAGKSILIEVKCGPDIVPVLKKVVDASSLEPEQIKVICFQAEVIAAVKRAMPQIQAYWLTSYKEQPDTQRWLPEVESVLATLARCDADGLDTQANRHVIDEQFVARVRTAGYSLHAWTVNKPEDARWLQSLGFDSITTDRPALLREALHGNARIK